MKENKTNTLLLTVIGVATLLVAVVGATFAYFTATLTGTETATTLTVGAGTLAIAYSNGSGNLVADAIVPSNDGSPAITKDFTVTGNNSTDAIMPYSLSLVVQENGFRTDSLTFTLTANNVGGNGIIAPNITSTGIPTGPGTVTLGGGRFHGVVTGSVHSYQLKIFFLDNNDNQDPDKNKTFKGYVNTTVESAYTTTP